MWRSSQSSFITQCRSALGDAHALAADDCRSARQHTEHNLFNKRFTKLWKCGFGASALFYHRRLMESCFCVSSRAALLRACGLDGAALVEVVQFGTESSGRALAGSV
jgi:hypothetical protein